MGNQEKNRFEIVTSTGEVLNLSKKIVEDYISPNAKITDDEFMFFFQLCKVQRLNPFLKEAYIIKYGNQPATIVTDYKVLQQIADRNSGFDGVENGVVVEDKDGNVVERNGQVIASSDTLIGGWCKVYRKDRAKPFYVTVSLKEFEARKKDGSLNAQWNSKPCFMIEKVAKAHAFRVAFPQEMQGVYVEDEVANDNQPLRDNQDEIIQQDEPVFKDNIIDAEVVQEQESNVVDFASI